MVEAGPLERLRLKPHLHANASWWPRTERRAAAVVLQAILSHDLVPSTKMTSEQIIFKLMVTFQPGGAGERTKILQAPMVCLVKL